MKNINQNQKIQPLKIIPLKINDHENDIILKAEIIRSNNNISTLILKGIRTKY